MIVDSHAHAFPAMGGRSGHRTRREHMRYVQHTMMTHHQPVRKVRDNSIVNRQTLYDGTDTALDALSDVEFRGGRYGRFVWTAEEDDHYIQYLPPSLARLDAPPEMMAAQMDYVGVDKAVLQTGHLYGRINRYLADAVRKFPDRFWGLTLVDEWRADDPGQIRALDHGIRTLRLHGLWFNSGSLRMHRRSEQLDDAIFDPFWDHVRDLGIPVYWHVSPAIPGPDEYLTELAAFGRWAMRFPEIPVVFTHGLPLSRFMGEDGVISIPEHAWASLEGPNVVVELLLPIFQGAIWEYPFEDGHPIIREYYERLGPDRLAWGSDMPNVERHCTYKQSLDYLRLYCDFIPSEDMEKILGGNVERMFSPE